MLQVGRARALYFSGALFAMAMFAGPAFAVAIDFAADGVQPKEGCAGATSTLR